MLTTTIRGLWARKRRLFATTTAVVLGVAFLVATLVVGDSMRAGFSEGYARVYAGADLIVRSSVTLGSDGDLRDVVDGDVSAQLAEIPGVAEVVPLVQGMGTIIDGNGDRVGGGGPPTIATNWITEPDLNPFQVAEGRAPRRDGEVIIDRRAATDGDIAVGDQIRVLVPEVVDVSVVGIAAFGDDDSFGPSTFLAFDAATAQDLLAVRADAASEVLVVAADDVEPTALRDEIRALLPADVETLTRDEIVADREAAIESDFVGLFERMLLAFAGIALIVATFSIHNTFAIVVAQRTRESALLRAIGASRRQVLLGVALEALIIGALAAAIGIGVGVLLGLGLQTLIAGAGMSIGSGLVVTTDTIVVASLVGVVTTVVASLAPAVRASRVAPLAALRDVAVDRSAASWLRVSAGVALSGGGVAVVMIAATTDEALLWAAIGALGVIVGAVVLGPVVALPTAAVLGGAVATTLGITGTLARRNAMRNPRRVAGSASALMVGTAVVALFATFGSSMKASIDDEVGQAFTGDLVVISDDFDSAPISADVATAIGDLPAVGEAIGVAFASATIDGSDVVPAVADPVALNRAFDLGVSGGDLAAVDDRSIAVSAKYADQHDLAVGDVVTMTFLDGAADFTVAARYDERLSFGDIVMTEGAWAPHARQSGDTVILINLAEGISVGDGKVAVAAITEAFAAPGPQTRDEYVDSVGSQIDQMLTLVYGLLGVAVLIALLGIANTLSLSIHERTRELGLLRAVGQTRAQLRSTVRWESVIVAVFGVIGGVGIGTFLGWGLMRAVEAQEDIGAFAAPWTVLAIIVIAAAIAGVLAALRPAQRAARLDVLSAIGTD
ncbi:MAG: ABC transporter permease [Desertimonas sp.]